MPTEERMSLLIVEDDPDTRDNLCDILELDGYTLNTAGSAAQALAFQNWPELFAIILDRKLPDGNAESLLPRLRELAPQAAVMIITGYADLEGAIAALRQGASDYILKPVDASLLRQRLARIAEHARVKRELDQSHRRLLQAERLAAIGEMMTGLAHESRNALQRSQACLEMLEMEVQDRPVALNLVARIQKAQDDLHRLYEEVRGYAAPIQIRRDCHDLRQVLRDTWEHLEVMRRGRDAGMEIDSLTNDCRCSVDSLALEQVFRNILENSLSACHDPVRIDVRIEECEWERRRALSVRIRDNGQGMNREQRKRIFEPFFTTKTHGTGLGMAIVKRLVEAHNGTVGVADQDGPGAEIVITIPRNFDERKL